MLLSLLEISQDALKNFQAQASLQMPIQALDKFVTYPMKY